MHSDDPELEDDEMTRTIDSDVREDEEERWIDSESEEDEDGAGGGHRGDGWDDEDIEAIPPRPRGRLLRPLPLTLLAVVIAAAGFLGGVQAQKGSEGSGSSAALPGGGELPSFAAGGGTPTAGGESGAGTGEAAGGAEASGGTEGAAAGLPSFGASNAAATGTVTSVEGHTIYVKESNGTVVAVKAGDGATVTRNSNVAAKKIHPGDSVVVEGSKSGSTVRASSIAATESGVESTTGFSAPTAAGGTGGGSESETSVESLFEE